MKKTLSRRFVLLSLVSTSLAVAASSIVGGFDSLKLFLSGDYKRLSFDGSKTITMKFHKHSGSFQNFPLEAKNWYQPDLFKKLCAECQVTEIKHGYEGDSFVVHLLFSSDQLMRKYVMKAQQMGVFSSEKRRANGVSSEVHYRV